MLYCETFEQLVGLERSLLILSLLLPLPSIEMPTAHKPDDYHRRRGPSPGRDDRYLTVPSAYHWK